MTIKNAIATPDFLPDGETTILNLSFEGRSSGTDGADVIVKFLLVPHPELSFEGKEFVTQNFVFGKDFKTFKKILSITNINPSTVSERFGFIRLIAEELETSFTSPTRAIINLK
ncbi:hypothetical protein [Parafilimonas terrae]|jgi:hypothetical protein|uniref:Uncharacterized protein n=1 Tax=Parafilimonas terrae TaxID=1465490 RepID=A0A1I5VN04_9BACT|nr:hypothetical protein [Parafilimonas terrae]SFQ08879.1 hypothetical protein SAMN05444277_10591 [Parafilimonas terrae]